MTKKETELPAVDAEIIKESQKWVLKNKGCHAGQGSYGSPRISSEIPDCSMPLTFDQYNYCSLGCLYCFAYFFKSNNPAIKDQHLKAVNADSIIAGIKGKKKGLYYEHFYHRKFLLHWGGLADPFCSFERANRTGLKLIETLAEENYPCLFSFKGSAIFDKPYMKIWHATRKQRNFAFQISMVTGSDEMAKRIEIGVPSPTRRLEAIRMLSDLGYWTILRLRPFIIGITDEGLDELLERALKAGIKGVSTEFFAMDCRSNVGMKTRYAYIAKLIGVNDLHKYFASLSPSERGGYMRLNRLVKEAHVKKIYTFCRKHGLVCGISDPDFKELNTSGSCCAMPDVYQPNPLLQNWTRNQLTFHLKQARRKFHTTGERAELRFSHIYKDESYLYDRRFANGHPIVMGLCEAVRQRITYRDILMQQWNNLDSPACPRNYLHGKVLPIGTDDEGCIIYKYTPSEYEHRWKEEGIDLGTL